MSTFENFNGETKTRKFEGSVLGGIFGAFSGLAVCLWLLSQRHEMVVSYQMLVYLVIFAGATGAFAFAGFLVGIGVPRFNPAPDQGLINRLHYRTWRRR